MKKASAPSILVAMMLLAVGVTAQAQQPKKVSRLGYLSPVDAATDSPRAEGIRLALRELGYIEGQNIAIEYRYGEGKPDRFPKLAAELVRLKVEIIVAAGGISVIRSAMNATKIDDQPTFFIPHLVAEAITHTEIAETIIHGRRKIGFVEG